MWIIFILIIVFDAIVEATRATDRHLHIILQGSNAARSAASDAAVTAIENDGGTVTTN